MLKTILKPLTVLLDCIMWPSLTKRDLQFIKFWDYITFFSVDIIQKFLSKFTDILLICICRIVIACTEMEIQIQTPVFSGYKSFFVRPVTFSVLSFIDCSIRASWYFMNNQPRNSSINIKYFNNIYWQYSFVSYRCKHFAIWLTFQKSFLLFWPNAWRFTML